MSGKNAEGEGGEIKVYSGEGTSDIASGADIRRASLDLKPLDLDKPATILTTDDALWFWRVVGSHLLRRRGLTEVDRALFTGACLAYTRRNDGADWAQEFRETVKALGLTERALEMLEATRQG